MKLFVKEIHNAWESVGKVSFGPANNEKKIFNLEDQYIQLKKSEKVSLFN